MKTRRKQSEAETADLVELVTRQGSSLIVEITTHPIYRQGRTIEVQGIATTTTYQAGWGLRETQRLLENVQARATPVENKETQFVYAYDVVDNNLSPEITPSIDRQTLFQ